MTTTSTKNEGCATRAGTFPHLVVVVVAWPLRHNDGYRQVARRFLRLVKEPAFPRQECVHLIGDFLREKIQRTQHSPLNKLGSLSPH